MGFFSDLFGGGSSYSSSNFEISLENEVLEGTNAMVIYMKGSPFAEFSESVRRDEYTSLNLAMNFQANDKSTDEPLLTSLDFLTDGATPIFNVSRSIGSFPTNGYWENWVEILKIPSDEIFYTPPHKTSLINLVFQIYEENTNRLIIRRDIALDFKYPFADPGYCDFDKTRIAIEQRGIKLAAAIACSDGKLSRKEGNVIKDYASKIVDIQIERHKDKTKKSLNKAIEEGLSYETVSKSTISTLCRYIKNVDGYYNDKMQVLDLCLDVMAADDVADKHELELIEKISKSIGIEYEEFVKVREKRMIGLKTMSSDNDSDNIESLERTLGVKSDWSKAKKIDYCKKEFRKWNSRLGALNDKQKQENAQTILDSVGKLLEHYKNA